MFEVPGEGAWAEAAPMLNMTSNYGEFRCKELIAPLTFGRVEQPRGSRLC